MCKMPLWAGYLHWELCMTNPVNRQLWMGDGFKGPYPSLLDC